MCRRQPFCLYSSSVGEVSAAGGGLAGSSAHCSTHCLTAVRLEEVIPSPLLSLWFLHVHTCVHLLLRHTLELLCVQKHQSCLSWEYSFPHVHRLFHVANRATRGPVCSDAHRRQFLCFSSRLLLSHVGERSRVKAAAWPRPGLTGHTWFLLNSWIWMSILSPPPF